MTFRGVCVLPLPLSWSRSSGALLGVAGEGSGLTTDWRLPAKLIWVVEGSEARKTLVEIPALPCVSSGTVAQGPAFLTLAFHISVILP